MCHFIYIIVLCALIRILVFWKSTPLRWLVHICESDSPPCQGGQELGKSLEADRHSPGLTSGFALGSGRWFATGYDSLHSLDICSLCLLASCFGCHLGSGVGLAGTSWDSDVLGRELSGWPPSTSEGWRSEDFCRPSSRRLTLGAICRLLR